MNFRPHQVCLSYTDSDNAVVQQETETIRVSNVQRLLHSQPVGLGLLIEISADFLADARDFF